MTPKENFYAMINGNQPEYAPCFYLDFNVSNAMSHMVEKARDGGPDAFGVDWTKTVEGVIPTPGKFLFEEITDWEKYVRFPDVNSLGMEALAAPDMERFDPNKPIAMLSVTGLFERMAAFMGFENTLLALAEDPEECMKFLDAFTDFRIKVLEKNIEIMHPDMIVMFDDIATARSMFMSPNCWREVFKPFTKRMVDFVRSKGVVYSQHTCGKCEDVMEDYVEIGIQWWNAAQTMNDLIGIMEKYGNRLIVDGGWDSEGPASYVDADPEVVVAETERCLREYSKYNNFCLFQLLTASGRPTDATNLALIFETWKKGCRH